MKVFRMVAVSAIAFMWAHAYAQEASAGAQQPVQDSAAQSVGGSNSTMSQMGSSAGKSRGQVYRELIQAEQNGDAARLRELFKGGN
jgi:hypothetical protein